MMNEIPAIYTEHRWNSEKKGWDLTEMRGRIVQFFVSPEGNGHAIFIDQAGRIYLAPIEQLLVDEIQYCPPKGQR